MPFSPQPLARPLAMSILMISACLFAANHVAARVAFDDGAGVLLAILARGSLAFLMMLVLVIAQSHRLKIPKHKRGWQLLLGVMIAGQSICLYSAFARIPIAVALLLVNTWPILYALLTWILGGRRPTLRLAVIMAVILIGLVMVLDIGTWLADPAAMGPSWVTGVILAASAALFFAVAIWVTENRLSQMPGAVRSLFTMMAVLVFDSHRRRFGVHTWRDGSASKLCWLGWFDQPGSFLWRSVHDDFCTGTAFEHGPKCPGDESVAGCGAVSGFFDSRPGIGAGSTFRWGLGVG
ncbi:MAG: DMT family transporter [Saccharospirillum sp.]|nr:DMT family transporter [Saccharospirillum sp.]